VPFFILAGEIMNRGGITHRLVWFAQTLVGHLRGGLAQVNVVANMLVSGISGSASADASAIGSMLIPSMRQAGYPIGFAVGLTAAAATMGPIIPPSILMVIYAGVTNLSIGALFLGGILPGVLIGLLLMLVVAYYARKKGWQPANDRASARDVFEAFRASMFALFTPVIIIGGILSGIFTATESGAVACVYATVVGAFVYKELRWRDFPQIFLDSTVTTAVAMIVVATAGIFGFLLARANFSGALVDTMMGISTNPFVVWILIILLLLFIGMAVEALPAMLIFVPAFAPLVLAMGFDELHFALVFLMLVSLGAITPPVGILLFICCSIGRIPVSQAVVWPFVFAIVAATAIVIAVPALVTAIPAALVGPR
jgi:tripartite ATP-independent transporter DctM subunit